MFLYLVGEEGREEREGREGREGGEGWEGGEGGEGGGGGPESLVATEPSCKYSELKTFKWKKGTHFLQKLWFYNPYILATRCCFNLWFLLDWII